MARASEGYYAMPPKKKDEPEEAVGAARFGRVRNNLKMGVVGLPNVGKSSLFNLLTDQSIAAENFPFCTIEPNEARCAVPDERYDFLCNMWKPPSEYPAYLHVTDIAGLVRGAAEGAGLGNDFLSHISAVDGIFHVVRAFDSEEVIHVDDSVDPVRDLETIQAELCAKDMQYLKKAVEQEKLDVKKNPTMKLSALFISTMDKVEEMLTNNLPIRNGEWTTPEVLMIKEKLGRLITTKPIVYLVNLSKKDFIRKKNKWLVKIHTWIKEHGGGVMIPFSVEFEQELWDVREDVDATKAFLDSVEGAKSALPKMVVQGIQRAKFDILLHRGGEGGQVLDPVRGFTRPSGRGGDPQRLRAGFHQGGGCRVRRLQGVGQGERDGGGQGCGQVQAGGKDVRGEGRRHHPLPVQRHGAEEEVM